MIHHEPRARALAVVLRAVLELIIFVEARATGQCEHLGNQVHVDGGERGFLLVAALVVLTEGGVRIGAQRRIGRKGSGHRADRGQAVRAAGERPGEVGRVALRDAEVVEIHVIVDDELLEEQPDQPAQAVVRAGAETQFVARVLVAHLIAPVADGRGALQRMADKGPLPEFRVEVPRVEIARAGADARVVRAGEAAHVVGVVLLPVDVPDHVAAGVHQAQQVAQLAVQRPGRALVLVLAVGRREGGDLVVVQRGAIRA